MHAIIEPSANFSTRLMVSGCLVRTATVWDEEWVATQSEDPAVLSRAIKEARLADIFAFSLRGRFEQHTYIYPNVLENDAVVRLSSFENWWHDLPQESRKNVRRSQRRGLVTSVVDFDDTLVKGITAIYNELPVRQGRRFNHYGKSSEAAKIENQTYLDRSIFIGAYLASELVGFMKLVIVGNMARIMQILSLEAHADKRPTNALLAKAVQACCERNLKSLIYGRYVYGNKENSPMTEFKRRNGFKRMDYPRYFVPLTPFGSVAIHCGLHLGLSRLLPERIITLLLNRRAAFYARKMRALPAD
jgi:hypothetical protein